jgi:hypothetical protein
MKAWLKVDLSGGRNRKEWFSCLDAYDPPCVPSIGMPGVAFLVLWFLLTHAIFLDVPWLLPLIKVSNCPIQVRQLMQ